MVDSAGRRELTVEERLFLDGLPRLRVVEHVLSWFGTRRNREQDTTFHTSHYGSLRRASILISPVKPEELDELAQARPG